jgi:hypothetical protein
LHCPFNANSATISFCNKFRFNLESLVPKVKSGDYFYFDEAIDNDERSIIEHWFFPKNKFQIIGTTNMALLFKVI